MGKNRKTYKEAIDNNINMNPGNPKGLPDESLFQNTIVFIDEAFLSKLSKFLGEGKYIKFDRSVFARNIAKKQKLNCEHIFLYIAPPFQDSIPSNEQFTKIKKIILISSDSDFVPVIKNLEDNEVKTILYTYYERGRSAEFSTSNELIKSVNKYILLDKEDLTSANILKENISK
ncbi:MAG: NYN domain-containing protein [Nanoarchaeota archaeon]